MSTIVLDAMGGDHSVDAAIDGVLLALERGHATPDSVILTGDEAVIRRALADRGSDAAFRIVHAEDELGDIKSPVEAMRSRPRNSVALGIGLLQSGEAGAFVSAGNTGLVVASAVRGLKCLEGIRRPGIAATIHGESAPFTVIDVGANPQPKPLHLLHYAIMGSAYYREAFGTERPRVGLLNIGSEDSKGNPLAIESSQLLKQAQANFEFVGNVEGVDVFRGVCDVVVSDGFTGNVLLKVSEGTAEYLMRAFAGLLADAEVTSERQRTILQSMNARVDFSEYGGALLLGIEGIVTICHGRSKGPAICNAIRVASQAVDAHVNQHIVDAARQASAAT
ncbi:MAG: phosphate acyltransferase PlsX [Planctomycetes bacterium]|nr:phosphate acyltransferase PlsX [Planctomycetota bacterium]